MVWNQLSTTPVIPLGGGSNATETFALRGPDPTETLVDIDGHRVNNGNTGDFDFSLIDPAALQEVQLVYGISPSSLIGPNTIGGGINITTLQPTTEPHVFLRVFGGSFGRFGETIKRRESSDRFGYAFSLHGTSSLGSVNQTILAGQRPAPRTTTSKRRQRTRGAIRSSRSCAIRLVERRLRISAVKLPQFEVVKDESSLLTNYTPPGFNGSGGDDAVPLRTHARSTTTMTMPADSRASPARG